MRKLYLIRHGHPALPDNRRYCIGVTDLPLDELGRMQGVLAGEFLKKAGAYELFSSPLRRACETAAQFGQSAAVIDGIREADAGEWDGLSFDDIRARWPDVYDRRGCDRGLLPPGGESYESQLSRFSKGLEAALSMSEGDAALVTHLCVTQTFLGSLLGLSPDEFRRLSLPHGSVTSLDIADGKFEILSMGVSPVPPLTDDVCDKLMSAVGVPENIRDHCKSVAEKAGELCNALTASGLRLDKSLVRSAALIHDIARTFPNHSDLGGGWLTALGYPRQGEIISLHMDFERGHKLDESAVVYMADKLTMGSSQVTLSDRFAASEKKCTTPQARAAHDIRARQALDVAATINAFCGKEFIK